MVRVAGEDGPQLFTPLGAFAYCGMATDIAPALRLAKDNGFLDRLVLVVGGECYKAVSELQAAARPVVLPEEMTYRETNPLTGEIRETFCAESVLRRGAAIRAPAGRG